MKKNHVDIKLNSPIEINGVETKTLRMREPTVGDQLAATENSLSDGMKEITFIANLCEVTPDDIKQLTLKDYGKVQEQFVNFTE